MQLIKEFVVGPASARSYIIGVVGNSWLAGWLVTQFSDFLHEVRGL